MKKSWNLTWLPPLLLTLEHESKLAPVLKLKDRKKLAEALTCYLSIEPPQFLDTPGYEKPMTIHERVREGIDCDEVFPNIILGNGATVRRKDYLNLFLESTITPLHYT